MGWLVQSLILPRNLAPSALVTGLTHDMNPVWLQKLGFQPLFLVVWAVHTCAVHMCAVSSCACYLGESQRVIKIPYGRRAWVFLIDRMFLRLVYYVYDPDFGRFLNALGLLYAWSSFPHYLQDSFLQLLFSNQNMS